MGLPRTFVGFSSTDILSYRMMLAWKAHEHIDFNFCDCQLQDALNATNEQYIKQRCRQQINMAGTYILVIGQNTWLKTTYVKGEVEVAIEKECRLIGVNIDKWRFVNPVTCPPFCRSVGALFVPFSPAIVAEARLRHKNDDWRFEDDVYLRLGYVLTGNAATPPPKPNPYVQ
jgi:hypothetical protein